MVTKKKPSFLAFDLGASGGRALQGSLSGNKLAIEEVCRFATGMIKIQNGWHWDIIRFFEEIKKGIKKCFSQSHQIAQSIAISTWGVDFGLLSKEGELLGLPFAYRDSRTDGIMEKVFQVFDKNELYRLTGIQFMQFNSIFQLYVMKIQNHPFLYKAKDLLFIPDILNYFLTGQKNTEFSFATTSQLYNPINKCWEKRIFEKLEFPINMMQTVIDPGSEIGSLSKIIEKETGVSGLKVFAPVSHDTGSAVASVPANGENWAYISSGTWSLLGIETKSPIISAKTRELNFTNEGGVDSTFRVQKNITGLWIIQKLKESIKELRSLNYPELIKKASLYPEFTSFIDGDHHDFLNPQDMKLSMARYLKNTNQAVPHNPFGFLKIALESMVMKYRFCIDQLQELSPHPIKYIHIIGGGSKNEKLNQYTANGTGKEVIAGPAEATSIGNIIVQAKAQGYIGSLDEARGIIKNSFSIKKYKPENREKWEVAYLRFRELLNH